MNSNNNITNPKCSNCKCYFIPDIKSSGQPFKTCEKCRTKHKKSRKCEHNSEKYSCMQCGGGGICEHDKRKSNCKQCAGSQICEHNKEKYRCKQCGGGGICEHDKRKSNCKQCAGSQICDHDKIKSNCKQCAGSQICEHDKRKSRCIQCGGSELCEHDVEKLKCPKCNEKLCYVRYHSKQIKRYLTSTRYEKIKNHYNDNLGCTVEEFMNHIKKKIEYFNTYLSTNKQMTLDNIHIDHIKPISQFNLDNADAFLDCCHYSNIQPLLSETNLKKSYIWTEENNKYWLDNIKGKEYNEIYIP
jgi:hypothetical protein